jgi:Ni/Co efflux regulator RcnB
MKRLIGAIAVLAFLATGIALGQASSVESTTKEKTSEGTIKTKTLTVTGTVKDYEAGKKITVTGPKDKDYTFDLDENVAMKGSISVGGHVKVSYTKSDGGDRVTTMVAYPSASGKKTKKTAA